MDGYIRKAGAGDKNVLGAISAKPSLVGDAQGCGWQGMYMKDKWGEILYEWVEEPFVPETTLKGILQEWTPPMIRYQRPLVNPAYDASRDYVPRTGRKEWAAVGLIGKLRVRDDGTCQQGSYCQPNADGIATTSEQGYLVLKRLDNDMVLVLLK